MVVSEKKKTTQAVSRKGSPSKKWMERVFVSYRLDQEFWKNGWENKPDA